MVAVIWGSKAHRICGLGLNLSAYQAGGWVGGLSPAMLTLPFTSFPFRIFLSPLEAVQRNREQKAETSEQRQGPHDPHRRRATGIDCMHVQQTVLLKPMQRPYCTTQFSYSNTAAEALQACPVRRRLTYIQICTQTRIQNHWHG